MLLHAPCAAAAADGSGVGDGEGDVEAAAWAALAASWAMGPTVSQNGFLNSTSSSCKAQRQGAWISQH